jgi:polar amino acid transport system substrate-binding protein
MNYLKRILCVALWLGFVGVNNLKAETYRVMGNNLPPFGLVNKNELNGFSRDLLTEMLELEIELDFVGATFSRVYNELQHAPKRVGLHIARTAQRENMFKWVGPYYTIEMGLIGKKDRPIKIESLEQIPDNYFLGAVKNTVPHQILMNARMDKSNIIAVPVGDQIMRMLDVDRFDLIAHVFDVSKYMMREHQIDPNKYEIKYSLSKADLYFAFSKDTPDGLIQSLQTKLDGYMATSEFQKLKERYYLN